MQCIFLNPGDAVIITHNAWLSLNDTGVSIVLGEHTGGESGVDLPLYQGVPLPAQQNGVLSNTKTYKRGERAYFDTAPADVRCWGKLFGVTRSKQCSSGGNGPPLLLCVVVVVVVVVKEACSFGGKKCPHEVLSIIVFYYGTPDDSSVLSMSSPALSPYSSCHCVTAGDDSVIGSDVPVYA